MYTMRQTRVYLMATIKVFSIIYQLSAMKRSTFKQAVRWFADRVILRHILMFVFGTFYFSCSQSGSDADSFGKPSVEISGPCRIFLPDQSAVLLKAGSSLRYDDSYGASTRKVILAGEAFFDVARDPQHPFIVRVDSVTTTVLGTAFNVRQAAGQLGVTVTVVSGTVKVSHSQGDVQTLEHHQQVIVDPVSGKMQRKEHVNLTRALSWQNEYLILDNVSLAEAVDMIAKRFNIPPIKIENKALRTCRITVNFFHLEDLDRILDTMAHSFNASFTRNDDGEIIIRGGTCSF